MKTQLSKSAAGVHDPRDGLFGGNGRQAPARLRPDMRSPS